MRLDSFLPAYFIREVHYSAVRASQQQTYVAFCSFDMAEIPWIRGLFQLRTLLERTDTSDFHLTLRDAYERGGFIKLAEIPDEELIVGAIGKIWRPLIEFEKVTPESFARFALPGYGKVAWSLKCEPRVTDGTLIRFELRVGATSTMSSAKMRGYYSVIAPFSRTIRHATLGRISEQLGDVFADEAKRALPGDGIIEKPAGSSTHAITIEAPSEAIWPWLVQMGEQRAGWYSYDWLDHAGIPSASRILPEFQQTKIDDLLKAGTNPGGGFFVLDSRPPTSFVLGACTDMDSGISYRPDVPVQPAHYICTIWSFFLEPQTKEITRLIVRASTDYSGSRTLKGQLRKIFMEQLHGFMERKQLENIKKRAEKFSHAA